MLDSIPHCAKIVLFKGGSYDYNADKIQTSL